MLRWLTTRAYNRIDMLWLTWAVLAWHERRYIIVILCIVVGAFASATLEAWNRYRRSIAP